MGGQTSDITVGGQGGVAGPEGVRRSFHVHGHGQHVTPTRLSQVMDINADYENETGAGQRIIGAMGRSMDPAMQARIASVLDDKGSTITIDFRPNLTEPAYSQGTLRLPYSYYSAVSETNGVNQTAIDAANNAVIAGMQRDGDLPATPAAAPAAPSGAQAIP